MPIVASVLGQAVTYLLAAAGIVGALASLWQWVFKPLGKRFIAQMKDDEIKPIVQEIAAQFRSDSGSTLKDTTNRLEQAVQEVTERLERAIRRAEGTLERLEVALAANSSATEGLRSSMAVALETLRRETGAATEALRIGAGIAGGLAEQDRKTLDRLTEALRVVTQESTEGAATGLRLEGAARIVADDLAAAQNRADNVSTEEPGAAADAASKPPDESGA
jgi:HAMP domain-containing protein